MAKKKVGMSIDEAEREAIRRWGRDAFASYNICVERKCEVGSGLRDRRWGEGYSFEEAFANAEANCSTENGRGDPAVRS